MQLRVAWPVSNGIRFVSIRAPLRQAEGPEPTWAKLEDEDPTKAKGMGSRIVQGAKKAAGRVADMGRVSKEHLKAAAGNQAQAAEDVVLGGARARDVLPEHAKEAGKDMKQWGRELGAAAKGETPEDVKVRDLPSMEPGQEVVEDKVRDRKVKRSSPAQEAEP